MSLSKVLIGASIFALAACGGKGSTADDPEVSGSEGVQQVAASADLWDTDLTHGFKARDDSTGVERGRQVYVQWCAICHAEGVGMAGTDSLRRKYKMAGINDISPILAERDDLTPGFIEQVVRNGIKSMPNFRKTEISDEDLALISAYLTQNNPNYEEE